jgi:diguanylate cyclase (GGDEF)-like protein
MKDDESFLKNAMSKGFEVAFILRFSNEPACIILISGKKDHSKYKDTSLTQLSVISNIASLALENIHQYKTIEKLSFTDSMTGVYNYRYFYKRLAEEMNRAARFGREVSLVIFDMDKFKQFNDEFGHQTGDMVLRKVSNLISRTVRSIDVVCRYGGEEFCIIMPDTGIENCKIFIERLRREISDIIFDSEPLSKIDGITVSVGGAVFPLHSDTPDRLIYCADMALLRAKSLGRNRAVMFTPKMVDGEKASIGEEK